MGDAARKNMPELLAPAGSPEALDAAIAAGADAVYLSGRRFGARKYATNFSPEEIAAVIARCHERDMRVYVTINTLIADAEMADALGDAIALYREGVDGIIVQDAGLLALLHRLVPGLELHASTQMTVHSVEGIRAVHELGARRVVLAREMTASEIADARTAADVLGMGLEVFIHGALCYSYSGQCLLSSLIGGRSGNRGACAQPCRKHYELLTWEADEYGRPERVRTMGEGPSYLLSPKDLCTYPRTAEVLSAGIDALKIEGRMKSPEYVAAVVAVYRRALDATAKGRFSPSDADMRLLLEAFNREFTGGYLLDGRTGTVMGKDFAANRGLLIGAVIKMQPSRRIALVRLNGMHDPAAGDGMVIALRPDRSDAVPVVLRRDPDRRGDVVELPVRERVAVGAEVFLTSGKAVAAAHANIMHAPLRRPLPLHLRLSFREATPVLAGTVRTRRGEVTFELVSPVPMEPARTQPVSAGKLRELIGRTGDVPYTIEEFTIDYPGDLFLPIGAINAFRRSFFEGLVAAVAAQYRPEAEAVEAAKRAVAGEVARRSAAYDLRKGEGAPPEVAVWVSTLEGVAAAAHAGATRVCFEPSGCGGAPGEHEGGAGVHTVEEQREVLKGAIEAAATICREHGAVLVWKWPHITREAWLRMAVSLLSGVRGSVDGVMVEGLGAVEAVREADPVMPVAGAAGLNVFNAAAVAALRPWCGALTLSPEMTLDQIRTCAAIAAGDAPEEPCRLAYLVHGPAELAVAEDCIFATATGCPGRKRCRRRGMVAGIRDAKGHIFPVTTDDACRTHIWNSRETCLVDSLPRLADAGIAEIILDCRIKPPAYTRTVTAAYVEAAAAMERTAGDGKKGAAELLSLLERKKEDLKKTAVGGLTAGHLYRGVLDSPE
ncbi:hypothetical protein AZH53_03730 [Methanomicrobiaceae archaeon CYW5]|uniref:U32 family peptidase n=1 Tax=Methanovulcanius yangii TaxID=1789227 RepID=UPI0029C9B31D|nr:U32 family peptidase [Methanovulcanius yangii]MBT8507532.1 hypothetical protein [Methanovulcanius yangii]